MPRLEVGIVKIEPAVVTDPKAIDNGLADLNRYARPEMRLN